MKWYQKSWLIYVSLLICFPLGIFLLYRNRKINEISITESIILVSLFILLDFLLIPKMILSPVNNNVAVKETNDKEAEKQEWTKQEIENKLKELSKNLEEKYDDMYDIRKYGCHLDIETNIQIMPFVALDKEYKAMIFDQVRYSGKDWIFFDEVCYKIGGKLYEVNYKRREQETNVRGNGVDEWYKVSMDYETFKILEEVANNSEVKVRFAGKKGYVDKMLSEKEIDEIRRVLEIYKFLQNVKLKKENAQR